MDDQKYLEERRVLEEKTMKFIEEDGLRERGETLKNTGGSIPAVSRLATQLRPLLIDELMRTFYPSDVNIQIAGLIGGTDYFLSKDVDYNKIKKEFNEEIADLLQEAYGWDITPTEKGTFLVNAIRYAYTISLSFPTAHHTRMDDERRRYEKKHV